MNSSTNESMTLDQFIEQYKIGIKAQYIDRQKDDDNWDSDVWKVTLTRKNPRRSMTLIFRMGIGHDGKPPIVADVLSCITSDAASIEAARDFEDFADELGYSSDSRKAERIYKACQQQTRKLKRFLDDPDVYELLLWDVEPY